MLVDDRHHEGCLQVLHGVLIVFALANLGRRSPETLLLLYGAAPHGALEELLLDPVSNGLLPSNARRAHKVGYYLLLALLGDYIHGQREEAVCRLDLTLLWGNV